MSCGEGCGPGLAGFRWEEWALVWEGLATVMWGWTQGQVATCEEPVRLFCQRL